MSITIYKNIEITETNGKFWFTINGVNNVCTNLRFAKISISRQLKMQ